jgi:outer membrane murein-binding lipoprotein Lpp
MQHFTEMENKIMASIDALNTAIAQLKTDIEAKIATLQTELANAVADLNTQIDAATASVEAIDAEVKA